MEPSCKTSFLVYSFILLLIYCLDFNPFYQPIKAQLLTLKSITNQFHLFLYWGNRESSYTECLYFIKFHDKDQIILGFTVYRKGEFYANKGKLFGREGNIYNLVDVVMGRKRVVLVAFKTCTNFMNLN